MRRPEKIFRVVADRPGRFGSCGFPIALGYLLRLWFMGVCNGWNTSRLFYWGDFEEIPPFCREFKIFKKILHSDDFLRCGCERGEKTEGFMVRCFRSVRLTRTVLQKPIERCIYLFKAN